MKNALLIVPCKTGYVLMEVSPENLPAANWHNFRCVTELDHYSRSNTTVIEIVREHFKEQTDA